MQRKRQAAGNSRNAMICQPVQLLPGAHRCDAAGRRTRFSGSAAIEARGVVPAQRLRRRPGRISRAGYGR